MRERRLCLATMSQPRVSVTRVVKALPPVSLLAGRAGLSNPLRHGFRFGAPRSDSRSRPATRVRQGLNGVGSSRGVAVLKIHALPACNVVGRTASQPPRFVRIASGDFSTFAKRLIHDTGAYCQQRRRPSGRPDTNSLCAHGLSGCPTTGYGAGMV
jgi:hypothetical protein